MSSKKRIVTETARIAQKWIVIETARIIPTKENESFEKTELFLRNLIWKPNKWSCGKGNIYCEKYKIRIASAVKLKLTF